MFSVCYTLGFYCLRFELRVRCYKQLKALNILSIQLNPLNTAVDVAGHSLCLLDQIGAFLTDATSWRLSMPVMQHRYDTTIRHAKANHTTNLEFLI